MRLRTLIVALSLFAVACGESDPELGQEVLRTDTDEWGLITCSGLTEDTTCFTHRALFGVSMGAGGAAQLGFLRPDLFDTVGMLGIPIVDWVYMMRQFSRSYMGGFCDRATILDHMGELSDPNGPAFCGPVPGVETMDPSGKVLEADQDFNHWYTGLSAGRGAPFGRTRMQRSIRDIVLAYGNPFIYSPDSPYLPPGVPRSYMDLSEEERCRNPVIQKGFIDAKYNPDGAFDVITVCDTATDTGVFSSLSPDDAPLDVALAVDYNQNGVRDASEPVILQMSEPYEDIGVDANDLFDWQNNPTGTRQNWLHDEGEPYEDVGLDGVAGTGDYGEGNGKFDYNPNIDNFWSLSARFSIERADVGQLNRINVWADAGIRDFLMSAGGTNWLWGLFRQKVGDTARDFTAFKSLAPEGAESYDFLEVDYSKEAIGQHTYLRYGDPDASPAEVGRGDGNHVGTGDQIINRFLTSLTFAQSRFHVRDTEEMIDDSVFELIQKKTYFSKSMNTEREYSVSFPPGYFAEENADKRYPVVYFLHGLGQESEGLVGSTFLFFSYMSESNRPDVKRRRQSEWAKFILVFPDSSCDDECNLGNFNTNHQGIDGDGPRFQDALFELMAHVEQTYRTALPVEVPRQ